MILCLFLNVRQTWLLAYCETGYTEYPCSAAVLASLGPMGRCVEDVELCFRAIVQQGHPENASRPDILPISFREIELPKQLRLGYFCEGQLLRQYP